eukprot:gene14515-22128_t
MSASRKGAGAGLAALGHLSGDIDDPRSAASVQRSGAALTREKRRRSDEDPGSAPSTADARDDEQCPTAAAPPGSKGEADSGDVDVPVHVVDGDGMPLPHGQ